MENVSDEDSEKLAGDGPHPVYSTGNESRPRSSNLLTTVISYGVSALRAVAPQIIPLFVFALLIPLIVAVSIFAGWLVWKNASVSWEAPLYLQYGCVRCCMSLQTPIISYSPQTVTGRSHIPKFLFHPLYRNNGMTSQRSLAYPSRNRILRSGIL